MSKLEKPKTVKKSAEMAGGNEVKTSVRFESTWSVQSLQSKLAKV